MSLCLQGQSRSQFWEGEKRMLFDNVSLVIAKGGARGGLGDKSPLI